MNKVTQGPQTSFYPLPVLVIGAMVDGKPNFMTAVYGGLANGKPPMLTVGIVRSRYTWGAIKVGASFSVNIPSAAQAQKVDFCGVESGSKTDKVARCGFKVFYGDLETAPMVEECPVNLECVATHIIDFDMHSLVVADIKQTHVSEDCLTDGALDPMKVDPLVFLTAPARKYVRIGGVVGDAFKIGKELP
ncbi:MAG: flavin reductase family protein [Dehalococcoidia bacterium]|nr:flavin reductase family protein [Dehalococcoidia bacterium]